MKTKKLCALVLAIIIAIGLMPGTVFAANVDVAEVNGVKYTELQIAIDAANGGDTVTLLKKITTTETILINKSLTLDLGKYTITGNIDVPILRMYSAVADTVIDITINATTGGIANTGIGYVIYAGKDIDGGTDKERTNLTINGGNYATNGTDCIYQIMGLCTINSGTYKSGFSRTVLNGKQWYGAEFTINGGSFCGFNPACVSVWTGFDGRDYTNFYHQHDIIAEGKTAEFEEGWYTVVDGTFEPKVETKSLCYLSVSSALHAVADMNDVTNLGVLTLLADDTLNVADALLAADYGFSFILNDHSLTLPAGFLFYDNRDVNKIRVDAVASVGDSSYDTLIAAVEAAEPGDTINLLANFEINDALANPPWTVYEMPEGSTLDLNGRTLTIRYGRALFVGKNITICNGMITPPSNKSTDYALYIGNTCAEDGFNESEQNIETSVTVKDLTITNGGICVLDFAKLALDNVSVTVNPDRRYYAVYANAGSEVIIESGTYTGGSKGIDVLADSEASLTISGGTFANRPEESYLAEDCEIFENEDSTYTVKYMIVSAVIRYYMGSYETVAEGDTVSVRKDIGSYPLRGLCAPAGYKIIAASGELLSEDGAYYIYVEVEELPEEDNDPVYRINIETCRHGDVTTKPSGASEGTTITVYVEPDKGYALDELTVTDRDGNEIELKDMGDGRYRFQMPNSKVNIEASFKKTEEVIKIVFTIDSFIALVNGSPVTIDAAPVIVNGRTMLPIRFTAEALGAEVEWVETERKVIITKGDTNIVIFIGSEYAYINGEAVKLDAAAFIEGNRTYLPLRFVAEALGADVVWDADARTVTVTGTK